MVKMINFMVCVFTTRNKFLKKKKQRTKNPSIHFTVFMRHQCLGAQCHQESETPSEGWNMKARRWLHYLGFLNCIFLIFALLISLEHNHTHLFVFSLAAFTLQWCWVPVAEIERLSKLKIFAFWPFTKKLADSYGLKCVPLKYICWNPNPQYFRM